MEKIIPETSVRVSNEIQLKVAMIGAGAPILFLHGFPELWYSWRPQMCALSDLGYRAIAPNLRGYGGSDAPPDPTSYTTLQIVGDLIGLLDALGIDRVLLVGRDWGAVVAWHLCLLRPDRVRALVNTTAAFMFRDPLHRPIPTYRAIYSDDFYMCRFQELGEVECELARVCDPANITKGFFKLFGGPKAPILEPNQGFDDLFNKPVEKPAWLTDEDVDFYAKRFGRDGFQGAINYYRAIDLTWELMAAYKGVPIEVPTKFIIGDQDLAYNFTGVKEYIHGGLKKDVPSLEEPVIVMEGVSHFLNQEKPDEVTAIIYEFFEKHKDQP